MDRSLTPQLAEYHYLRSCYRAIMLCLLQTSNPVSCGHVDLSVQPATRISGTSHGFSGTSYGFKAKYYDNKALYVDAYLKSQR